MKLVALILCFYFVFVSANAQNSSVLPHTNTYFLKKLITENLTDLDNKIIVLGKEKVFNVFIDNNSNNVSQKFFYNTIRDRFAQYNLIFESVDSTEFKIFFFNLLIKTEYPTYRVENLIGNRYITRVFTVKFDYKLVSIDDSILLVNSVKAKYQDEVLLDYIDYVQDPELPFTCAELPRMRFTDRYLVPTIMIAVSGLAIVLFFTIRSK
ncbi:MAG: hypothetical protein ACP5P3_01685 [Ignavibacteria bacterium]